MSAALRFGTRGANSPPQGHARWDARCGACRHHQRGCRSERRGSDGERRFNVPHVGVRHRTHDQNRHG